MADPLFDATADRRSFFRRLLGEMGGRVARAAEHKVVQHRYARPPGAIDEISFLASCTRCGLCSQACPHDVIATVPAKGGLAAGTPVVDLTRVPCEVCVDIPCAAACPTGALVKPATGWSRRRLGRVVFEPKRCITFQGHHCTACVDACPVGSAALSSDAEGHPVLKAEGCVGCGHCVRDCVSSPSSFTFIPMEW